MNNLIPPNARVREYVRNAEAATDQAARCTHPDAAAAFRLVAQQWRDLAALAARTDR